MKKNILITGVLGYVGTNLCRSLIKSNKYRITGTDINFNDSVSWLIKNKVQFYQLDLFHINHLLKDIDYVIHCGAVTNVPSTIEQSTPEIDKNIYKVCIDGTREIINNVGNNTKIIFLSSHTVYDGLKEQILNIKEDFLPQPLVAYSIAKRQSEVDLINNNKNFIILRLGSVTGLGYNMRYGIVGNLFARIASQNQKIKLFGNGQNIKPLICLKDVIEAIEFFLNNDFNKKIFHCVSENLAIKQIAEICKIFNSDLIVEETKDIIPNLGYSLCNKKLLNTGFVFKQDIKDEIEKMIKTWSNK